MNFFSGTRSTTRALENNGFKKINEVRITRNTILDRVLVLKKPNYKIDRRHSADERQRGTNANISNSVQTKNTPKSILKKPKKNPFNTSGRRKSMDARVNINSVSGGSNDKSISVGPSSSVQFNANETIAQNLLSIRPSSTAFRAIPTSTFVPNSLTTGIIRSNQNGFEMANLDKENVSLVPSKYPSPFALQFRTASSSKKTNGKSDRSVRFK